MSDWILTDAEWNELGPLLADPQEEKPRRGRPRVVDDKAVAEACLYRHYHAHAAKYRSFGWHQLPKTLGVTPNTANRRFRVWTAIGAWARFWDALMQTRGTKQPPMSVDAPPPAAEGSIIRAIIAELERSYQFLNVRFFGGALSAEVVIALEHPGGGKRKKPLGYFCQRQWRSGERVLGHIAISTTTLGRGSATVLQVLLHEMVHLRNHQVSIEDCDPRTQYHNQHFRDVARIAGLECRVRDPRYGYGATELAERGREALRELRPNEDLFAWTVGSDPRPSDDRRGPVRANDAATANWRGARTHARDFSRRTPREPAPSPEK